MLNFVEKGRGDKICARSVSCSCVTSRLCASRSVAVVQRPCVLYFDVPESCAQPGTIDVIIAAPPCQNTFCMPQILGGIAKP